VFLGQSINPLLMLGKIVHRNGITSEVDNLIVSEEVSVSNDISAQSIKGNSL
jgi:hypothetical protein